MRHVRLPSIFRSISEPPVADLAKVAAAIAVLGVSLWLARSPETTGDAANVPTVIPHHSIAVLTSERAHVRDPKVGRLADGFVEAKERETSAMRQSTVNTEAVPTDAKGLPLRAGN
jgi:hypothetical protein